ncbi:tctex1 domain-containing protein 1 [Syncephalastrum racemosum]|uniref:Tctex1 domain-containing protein 1 n=1 Tax=Syncephalastrum racemosum TaxID=13706 RepID=A0A1X2HVG2_SYNRA|nr:tctex1 domain-containing protein 1 [Syncephalastrum racemosum]
MDTSYTAPSPSNEEKPKFSTDQVTAIIKESVEATLNDAEYTHSKVPQWNSEIAESCLKKLREMSKNYKYVVTCVIMQRNGAGFYAGSSVYWDNQRDGSANYRFENKSMFAIVNVFGLSV